MIKKAVVIFVFVMALALIGLFTLGPIMTDKSLNGVTPHKPFVVSDAAKELHASLIIGDWHSDSLLWDRDLGKRYDYGHVDIPRLQAGNVSLQMFTTVTKSPSGLNYDLNSADASDSITKLAIVQRWPTATWRSLTARALHQADRLHSFEEQNPNDLMIIKSKADLANFTTKRLSNTTLVGGLLGTEGSHALDGKLANVQTLFGAGFRMMSLQHFFDNKLGASLHGVSQTGLTDFGRQVINKFDALNIILDVSHSSEAVVAEVLALYNKPVVVSHTGFKGHCDTARNIADSLMQQIAANGGLIAVGYWEGAVCGDSPKDVVAAMKYGLELVGEDHMSLGSDYDGSITAGFDTSELVALTDEMLKAGFSHTQISKIMGGNMIKFLRENLPN
ncbi:MAG: membrane dipeptidase [Arenicella sp.]|nr:membrane dipeptidase [Arenicella sp.]